MYSRCFFLKDQLLDHLDEVHNLVLHKVGVPLNNISFANSHISDTEKLAKKVAEILYDSQLEELSVDGKSFSQFFNVNS